MCVVLAVRPLKSSLITEDARCWLGPWSVFYHHPPRRGLSTLGPPERAARTPRGRESREPVLDGQGSCERMLRRPRFGRGSPVAGLVPKALPPETQGLVESLGGLQSITRFAIQSWAAVHRSLSCAVLLGILSEPSRMKWCVFCCCEPSQPYRKRIQDWTP